MEYPYAWVVGRAWRFRGASSFYARVWAGSPYSREGICVGGYSKFWSNRIL